MGQCLKRAMAATAVTRLDVTDRLILQHTPADGGHAYWTSDIAYDCRLATALVRRRLGKLSEARLVERVVIGNPTSWRRTEIGTAALATAN